jgi:hypothetical protein
MGLLPHVIDQLVQGGAAIQRGRLTAEQAARERQQVARRQHLLERTAGIQAAEALMRRQELQHRIDTARGNTARQHRAYQALGYEGEPLPGVDYVSIYEQREGARVRQDVERDGKQHDEAQNRQLYDLLPATAFPQGAKPQFTNSVDWAPLYRSFVTGEMGQDRQREIRIEFPPARGGDGGDMTPTQRRAAATAEVQAEIANFLNRPGAVTLTYPQLRDILQRHPGAMTEAQAVRFAQEYGARVRSQRRTEARAERTSEGIDTDMFSRPNP